MEQSDQVDEKLFFSFFLLIIFISVANIRL